MEDLSAFPGGDLVAKGLADLEKGILSEEALLVLIASPRLVDLGFVVPELKGQEPPYEMALYSTIEARSPEGAYADYNALIRRIVSFAQCYKAD